MNALVLFKRPLPADVRSFCTEHNEHRSSVFLLSYLRAFFLAAFGLWGVCLLAGGAHASEKKGLAIGDVGAGDRVAALNVAWYYTWGPTPLSGAPRQEFVPMLWGGKKWDSQLAQIKALGKVDTLLVVNEPDHADQANMSVGEVVDRWPELEPLARRLSSPAPANAGGGWFSAFYKESKRLGLRYQFISVHAYPKPDAKVFLKHIDELYDRYKMPIWITEFAAADWSTDPVRCKVDCVNHYSEADVIAFMRTVLTEFEKRPYIERYALYGAGKRYANYEPLRTSRLFTPDGRLTALGCFYANFGTSTNAQESGGQDACNAVRVSP